ncbi:hypothetical protein BGX31_004403 [Mortierella sp. GBA43]|nr:hypothetical protein BGX31_004403 [Mortierella sp. GBA43]
MLRCTSTLSASTLLLLLATSTSVHAQKPYRPATTCGPYYNFVEGQALYIGGGRRNFDEQFAVPQNFAINFTVSWNTSSPAFVSLPDGPAFETAPSAITPDNKQWMVCSTRNCYKAIIGAKEWKLLRQLPNDELVDRVAAAVDPQTGIAYIPNGYNDFMLAINMATGAPSKEPMPPPLFPAKQFAFAWSRAAKKMFFFGGTTGAIGQTDKFSSYSYSKTEGWKDLSLTIKGQIPAPRMEACMGSAYGGTKIVLFGGFTMDRVKLHPDIYVFDVATMTWTKGANPAAKDQRGKAACGVSGDYFVAWGGLAKDGFVNTTAVYNIKTNAWTTSFIASLAAPIVDNSTTTSPTESETDSGDHLKGAPGGPQSSDESTSGGTSKIIVIVASVLGVVVVGLAAWVMFLFRSHRRRGQDSTKDGAFLRNPSSLALPDDQGRSPHVYSEKIGSFGGDESTRNPQPSPIEYSAQSPMEQPSSSPHASVPEAPSPAYSTRSAQSMAPQEGQDYHIPTSDALHSLGVYSAWSQCQAGSPHQGSFGSSEIAAQNPHVLISGESTTHRPLDTGFYDSIPLTEPSYTSANIHGDTTEY